MSQSTWFTDLPVLGKLPPERAAAKLRELGEHEAAEALETAQEDAPRAFGQWAWWPFQDKPWQHTAHAFGYPWYTASAVTKAINAWESKRGSDSHRRRFSRLLAGLTAVTRLTLQDSATSLPAHSGRTTDWLRQ
jgi:hypothetical protein